MILRVLISVTCAALLVACSINVLPERTPADRYALPPSTLDTDAAVPVLDSLRLSTPTSSDTLSGSRLLVRMEDGSLQAFPGVQWETGVPTLWRDWLLDAFWQDGRVSGLSSDDEGLRARLELGGMLRSFNMVQGSQFEAVIRYDARLVDLQSRSIVASRRFEIHEPAQDESATAGVQAMGRAADQLVRELIDWTIVQAEVL